MADVHSPEARRRNMEAVRGTNTRPELLIRRAIFAEGFRFKLHDKRLPGKPDIVLPKYKAVIQVHGCFWHGHDCNLFKWPTSNVDFWRKKIELNKLNDDRVCEALAALGWRVLTVWECSLKGKCKLSADAITKRVSEWLLQGDSDLEIFGDGSNAQGTRIKH